MYRPIADYALLGDGRSAALVARDGSVDWLCWPRFDSPALFAALLDDARGGSFQLGPTGPCTTSRRYLPDTNVLETTFQTPSGAVAVLDALVMGAGRPATGEPAWELLRQVEGREGTVELAFSYAPRPNFGQRPSLHVRGSLGVWCGVGRGGVLFRADVPVEVDGPGGVCRGTFTVAAGQQRSLSLSFAEAAPAPLPLLGEAALGRLEETVREWRAWAAHCTYAGPYRQRVVRGALTLRVLVFAASGAIVAAPTTSLPERIGGQRNWGYRYCWLRDAAFTVRALVQIGCADEARAFAGWMLHATRLTWPELQVVYSIYGEARLPERELAHLDGYAGSRPVRVGNDAHGQLQLDVYGEVAEAYLHLARAGDRFDAGTRRLLVGLGETACRRWREPDHGIWEARAQRSHRTHSKAMCWVALDRLLELHALGALRVPEERFRRERDAIRAEIETRGFNTRLGTYTATFDGDDLDAALLTLPLCMATAPPRARACWPRSRRSTASSATARCCAATRTPPTTAWRPARAPSVSAAFGPSSTWPAQGAWTRRNAASPSCSAAPTTSASSPRRSTRRMAPRSATRRSPSRTSA